MRPTGKAVSGLRERNKARTRIAIQTQAVRLFREHGYDATSVARIAEAAEVSESTFFRYFPTKEDVILWDEFGTRGLAGFRSQPTQLSAIEALHASFRDVFSELEPDEMQQLRDRMVLMVKVPPLRARIFDFVGGPMHSLAEVIAERAGCQPTDPEVRTLVGAVVGVGLSLMFVVVEDPNTDILALLDIAMSRLSGGFGRVAD